MYLSVALTCATLFFIIGYVLVKGIPGLSWRFISTKPSYITETIVIPQCTEGIITGCILSSGRILGESAALLFTAGFSHALHGFFEGISSSGATLTVALYVYAKEQGEFQVAFSIAVILLALSVVVNGAAELIKNKGRCRHK